METESPAKDIEIKKSPKKESAGSPKKEPKTPEPAKKKSASSPKKEPKTAEPANTKEPATSPKKETKTPEKAQEEPTESPNVKEQAEPETPKPSASGDANEKSENNTETQSAKKKKKKNKKNKNKENDAGKLRYFFLKFSIFSSFFYPLCKQAMQMPQTPLLLPVKRKKIVKKTRRRRLPNLKNQRYFRLPLCMTVSLSFPWAHADFRKNKVLHPTFFMSFLFHPFFNPFSFLFPIASLFGCFGFLVVSF